MAAIINGDGIFTAEGTSTSQGRLRLGEDTDNGTTYVELQAAANIPSNVTFTLPSADGTTGQVLQTNGSGALSFATPATGAMTKISTQTASSSASLEWTGLATYRSYMLVLSNIVPAVAGDQLNVQIGTGSTPTYIASSYYYSSLLNASNSSIPDGHTGSNDNSIDLTGGFTAINTGSGYSGVVYLINMLASPVSDARIVFSGQYPASSTTVGRFVTGGGFIFSNTNPKTAVKIFFDTRNISTGSATLYGLEA